MKIINMKRSFYSLFEFPKWRLIIDDSDHIFKLMKISFLRLKENHEYIMWSKKISFKIFQYSTKVISMKRKKSTSRSSINLSNRYPIKDNWSKLIDKHLWKSFKLSPILHHILFHITRFSKLKQEKKRKFFPKIK